MRARALPLALLVVGVLLAACGERAPGAAPAPDATATAPASGVPAAEAPDRAAPDTLTIVEVAERAREALAARDFDALAGLVHPARGLRFSPYGYVDTTEHVVLPPAAVASLPSDTTTRLWGHYDGTGEPIRLRFDAYYDEFVYDAAFGEGRRGAPGERIGQGNSLNNIGEVFGSEATFVEYHVPGSEEYDGMDWNSLRLVVAPYQGRPRLVGVVHDQWTI